MANFITDELFWLLHLRMLYLPLPLYVLQRKSIFTFFRLSQQAGREISKTNLFLRCVCWRFFFWCGTLIYHITSLARVREERRMNNWKKQGKVHRLNYATKNFSFSSSTLNLVLQHLNRNQTFIKKMISWEMQECAMVKSFFLCFLEFVTLSLRLRFVWKYTTIS